MSSTFVKFASLIALMVLAACSPPASKNRPDPVVASELVLSHAPSEGARVTSPLTLEGTAPNDWYFEGQFQTKLLGADGATIAEAPALPQTDWQKPGPVAFVADLVFEVAADTPATLVLQEDMTPEGQAPRERRIGVVLAGGR